MFNTPLISCDELLAELTNPKLLILDASMHKRVSKGHDYPKGVYIDGAHEFDFSKNRFQESGVNALPNTLPSEDLFTEISRSLGVNNDSIIVVYDRHGNYSAPRARWMFKTMGHKSVFVLNGGLIEWLNKGYSLANSLKKNSDLGNFSCHLNRKYLSTADEIESAIGDDSKLIVDARPRTRFNGHDPEPRENLRRGNIANSINIPYSTVLEDSLFKDKNNLISIFERSIDNSVEKVIFYCGSGVTACIPALAAESCGYTNLSIYDGSWSEWGANSGLAII